MKQVAEHRVVIIPSKRSGKKEKAKQMINALGRNDKDKSFPLISQKGSEARLRATRSRAKKEKRLRSIRRYIVGSHRSELGKICTSLARIDIFQSLRMIHCEKTLLA